jgi:hypothetical protein
MISRNHMMIISMKCPNLAEKNRNNLYVFSNGSDFE